ncbi:MAG: hypothetical protein EA370_06990 [Wenzhouxiangella sp.]|nr:MAG: hypothetical protein EA370_06990 [Wenzhouxiangella sp.]
MERDTDEEPTPSEFLADSLHPIDPAAPGRFRMEVAGEVHEGELSSCGWSIRVAEGHNQDRFAASANWRTDDGRSLQLEMWRFVMHDDFFWNLNHGHESDRVRLRLRTGGDPIDSLLLGLRAWPGADIRWRWGTGEMPAVHVVAEGPQATVVGELQGTDRDGASNATITGAFSLAVHCAEN